MTGYWQQEIAVRKYDSRELLVQAYNIVTESSLEIAQQLGTAVSTGTFFERAAYLNARCAAQSACAQFFRKRNFTNKLSPLVVGESVFLGTTKPFPVSHSEGSGYLPVNNQIAHHYSHAAGMENIWEFARLFWAHSYSNPNDLNEISVVEFSMANADRLDVKHVVEELLREVSSAVSSAVLNSIPFEENEPLPTLEYREAESICSAHGAGLPGGHALTRRHDELLCDKLGVPGYWLIDSPPEHNPFYVRTHRGPHGTVYAKSLELRLRSFELGAGSEWNSSFTDVRDVEKLAESADGRQYLGLLANGFPQCSGFTFGLDRFLTYILKAPNIRHVVPEARIGSSFRDSARCSYDREAHACNLQYAALCEADPPRLSWIMTCADALMEKHGFLRCDTSLLNAQPSSENISNSPTVCYFGHSTVIGCNKQASHEAMLSQGCDRIYEAVPKFDRPQWWHTGWTLEVCWIEASIEPIWKTMRTILGALVEDAGDGLDRSGLQRAIRLLPEEIDCERLAPGLSRSKPESPYGEHGVSWSFNGRVLISGGRWLRRDNETGSSSHAGRFGYLTNLSQPGGGFEINLSALAEQLAGTSETISSI